LVITVHNFKLLKLRHFSKCYIVHLFVLNREIKDAEPRKAMLLGKYIGRTSTEEIVRENILP